MTTTRYLPSNNPPMRGRSSCSHNTQLYGGAKGLSTSNFSNSLVNKLLFANPTLPRNITTNTPYSINSSKSLLPNYFMFDGHPNLDFVAKNNIHWIFGNWNFKFFNGKYIK